MHNYQGYNGSFPPAVHYSKEGKPLLSWRVLLLPYIEQRALFEQFKLDEPWDSEHNLRLLPKMPITYEAFDGRAAPEPHSTFFRVFVGKGAAFEGTRGLRSTDDFPDGTSNTILIVQTTEAVPWTKPAELEYSPRVPLPCLDGFLPKTFQIAFADGSTMTIRNTVSEKTLRAAITRNGNDHADIQWPD